MKSKIFIFLFLTYSFFCNTAVSAVSFDEGVRKLDAGDFAEAAAIADKLEPPASYQLKALNKLFAGDYPGALKILDNIKPAENALDDYNLLGNPESLRIYLKKLIEITTGFSEYESEHFRLRLEGTDEVLKDSALEALEIIRAKIGDVFGYMPDDKVLVEIYPAKNAFAAASTLGDETLERSGAIGICKFNRLMVVSPGALPQGYRWLDALCHEYVHFTVNRVTKGSCPLWLHEGIARYHDTIWRVNPPRYSTPGNNNLLASALNENRLISFKQMSPSLVYLKNQDEVNLAFVEVSNAIDFMKKKYGDKFKGLVRALKDNGESDAFRQVFNFDQFGFEKNWIESLKVSSVTITPGAASDKIFWRKYDEIDAFVGISARDYIRLGDRFRMLMRPENGAYTLALSEYEKALKIEPNNPVALLKAARMYFAAGESGKAVSALELCIDKNPNYVSAYELLGEWYISADDFTGASTALLEALAINPYNPFTHINLAKAYLSGGNKEKAHREFANALYLDPQNMYLIRMVNETKISEESK